METPEARGQQFFSQRQLTDMERWPSGLRYLLGKQAYEKSYRGFESLPFRHNNPRASSEVWGFVLQRK